MYSSEEDPLTGFQDAIKTSQTFLALRYLSDYMVNIDKTIAELKSLLPNAEQDAEPKEPAKKAAAKKAQSDKVTTKEDKESTETE